MEEENKSLPTLIIITGPTASGKTGLSLKLAKELKTEIINADSVQVYKDFNIGSAKPSVNEQQEVKHHLLSFIDPNESYDTSLFIKDAKQVINNLQLPIISGGTGLYIRSLLHGLVKIEQITEQAKDTLASYEVEANKLGVDVTKYLYQTLMQLDSQTALGLVNNDQQRIKRALLVRLSTDQSLKQMQIEHKHSELNYRALVICLMPERNNLYSQINKRVEQMFEQGLIKEVKDLMNKYPLSVKPFQSIGYREVLLFLKQEITENEMIELIKQKTRNFAKRQYTWWKNQPQALNWEACNLGLSSHYQLLPEASIFDIINRYLKRQAEFNFDKIWFLPLHTGDY